MNEEAINLLRRGSYVDSVSLLDRALGSLMNEESSSTGNCSCDHSVSTKATDVVENDDSWSNLDTSLVFFNVDILIDNDDSAAVPIPAIRSIPLPTTTPNTSQGNNGSINNIFEFYANALVLDRGCLESTRCVILYNMGISYHLEALRLQQNRAVPGSYLDGYYQYALNMYNMAQLHLHQAWCRMTGDDEAVKLHLALALSNNCGHIHAHRLHFKEIQFSLDAVKHLMHSLADDKTCSLTGGDRAFFCRASLIFDVDNCSIAPSA